jgi:hypothetical protein
MTGPATENQVRAAVDRAADEMIYIGPGRPYYLVLADLVSAVGKAWQQGFEQVGSVATGQPLYVDPARRITVAAG